MKLPRCLSIAVLSVIALCCLSDWVAASGGGHDSIGATMPLWYVIPFVGMLLSIAIFPLINGEWWEKRCGLVVIFWSLVVTVMFLVGYGPQQTVTSLLEQIILDYLPFIVLLYGLFTVAGGIVLKGTLVGTTRVNVALITIGMLLASWIGTTGASMLMIRPLIRANAWRKRKVHIIIFFIFLVANIGGCLTPVGDPPLFLGFLRGVPFFWTMRLLPMLLFNAVVLLAIFIFIDRNCYEKDLAEGCVVPSFDDDPSAKEPLRVEGLHNLLYVAMIVGAVILCGILPNFPFFADPVSGELHGLPIYNGIELPYNYLVEMLIILLAAFLSLQTTKKQLRADNYFTWGPIKEVATLFIGIFVTMIPALAILAARGAELGLTEAWQFFWVSGLLSSFLDNAPTYLVFLTTAGALGATEGVVTTVGTIAPTLLLAISAGSVFMGANTYIGNAPNFMVRSIAEENAIKMPSFFGYMAWSLGILVPLFFIDTLIFLL